VRSSQELVSADLRQRGSSATPWRCPPWRRAATVPRVVRAAVGPPTNGRRPRPRWHHSCAPAVPLDSSTRARAIRRRRWRAQLARTRSGRTGPGPPRRIALFNANSSSSSRLRSGTGERAAGLSPRLSAISSCSTSSSSRRAIQRGEPCP